MIKIKAGRLNNLSDARFFSTFSEWLGFDCDPLSSKALDIVKAKEMMAWVTGPRIIGEFGDAPTAIINQYATNLMLDSIEVSSIPDMANLATNISSIYYRIPIHTIDNAATLERMLASLGDQIAAFILSFEKDQIDWAKGYVKTLGLSLLQDLCELHPIILSYPFSPENVLPITQSLSLQGIELVGGNETQIGIRSFDELEPILEILEVA